MENTIFTHGQQRNQPIVRFGNTALITDEKIEWKETIPPKLLQLYLLNADITLVTVVLLYYLICYVSKVR
jgi:hypothetical protein